MGKLVHEINEIIWNIYQNRTILTKEDEELKYSIFPSSELETLYEKLHNKLIQYRGSDEVSVVDIAMFVNELPMYIEGLNGFEINKTGTKIGFVTEEYVKKIEKYLIRMEDVDNIAGYQLVGDDKKIIYLVRSPQEQIQVITHYMLLKKPEKNVYYFKLGDVRNFSVGSQIGSGLLYPFEKLPSSVRKSWKFWKAAYKLAKIETVKLKDNELQTRGFVIPEDITPEEDKIFQDKWFMRIEVSSVGAVSSDNKAISAVNANLNIIKFFCNVRPHVDRWIAESYTDLDYYQGEPTELLPNEQHRIGSDKLGIVNFANTEAKSIDFARIPEFDQYIESINAIIMKMDKDRTDLESSIINAIDIFGMIEDLTPLHLKFLLSIISLESLLMGSENH